jgi:hypothetical protein
MESPDEHIAEPEWVSAVLDERVNPSEYHQNGPTIRAEFVRRVMRADLGHDQEPILRAGMAALDHRLGIS